LSRGGIEMNNGKPIHYLAAVSLLMVCYALYAASVTKVLSTTSLVTVAADTNWTSQEIDIQRDSLYKFTCGLTGSYTGSVSFRLVPIYDGATGDTLRLDSAAGSGFHNAYVTVKGDSIQSKFFGGLADTNNTAREYMKQQQNQVWKFRVLAQKKAGTTNTGSFWVSRITN